MRALLLSIGLAAVFAPAHAQPLEIIGYSGFLGEWELTATVTEAAPGRQAYSGPLTMKHVGLCTQDGPEERTGEMHLELSGLILQIGRDIVGCRGRMQLQRTIVRFLYRHVGLPRPRSGSAENLG